MLEQQPTQNPLTVSMLNAQAQQVDRPLRENVKQAVRNYLRNLDGQDPTELYELVLSEIEHPMLDMVMQHTRGNQTRAATMLGINRGTLRKKLKKYGMG
ncbi:DNA-binding transcriptional regulator Fis [Glaesserella parasuis]|uniref:DNA-binding protein Fis n=4 Tax=Glaesserella parasuis TaxID=738 RepID=FIS_GLAP5|nr:DNA-binding transcriptional regulator Fis [Glaesserella parasuis]B8F6J8.1 RecName: Full=DNA-binding protein Fis [Glaesserella parasuis SH0165]EQA01901.1 fis transcriptional dual regulator [Glaesserella parasuis SW114]EQA05287.1 DNA-binding protein fis [Glaesserella parasuis 12939]EQA13156.1 DNA-binding protein fis [Glaesserella parasuis SW140]ACL32950.1 DNA-binding protein Fis [Glaesserella parasuis SH0165]AMW16302.1 Fis family transcriptional regulator [Glaesserella parasuis]